MLKFKILPISLLFFLAFPAGAGEDSESGGLIPFYQKWISPQDKSSCVFYPTCSEYTRQAIDRYGFLAGVLMGADRINRCHQGAYGHYPLTDNGKNYDPLPEKEPSSD